MEIKEPLKIQEKLEIVCIAHAYFILFTLSLEKEPITIPEITRGISKISRGSINLQDQQTRIPTQNLASRGLLREIPSKYGRRRITKYEITDLGTKFLNAIQKFLEALE